jgi:1-acyl-sn-glycerol-3-phosphate acyltransferase
MWGRTPVGPWLKPLWWLGNYWLTYWLYLLGWSYRCEGSRHVPAAGPALLLANHQSFLDPHAVGLAAPHREVCFLARKTLFKNPLVAWYMTSLNVVPVDHHGVAKEGLKTVIGLLEAGKPLLMFPEGERTHTGAMQPLRPGVHLILKRAPVPVVPVGVAGAFDAFPRRRKWPVFSPPFLPTTGADIAVSVGRPLDGRELVKLPREPFLRTLSEAIAAAKARAERLRRRP